MYTKLCRQRNNTWRGGTTGRTLDLRSTGRGFKCYSRQKLRTTLGKLFTPMRLSPCSITWYRPRGGDALRWKVTAGLAESNGSLSPGRWRADCLPESAPGPTLGNECGKPLPFLLTKQDIWRREICSVMPGDWWHRGKMLVSDLETKLVQAEREGCRPFLVVATAGTTVLGAFDDLNDIADVCQRHAVWLHVDVRCVKRQTFWTVTHSLTQQLTVVACRLNKW